MTSIHPTSNRILQINATATAATGLAMLAGRGFLPPLFGLGSPILLDLIAIFFLAYAAGLLLLRRASTRRTPRAAGVRRRRRRVGRRQCQWCS